MDRQIGDIHVTIIGVLCYLVLAFYLSTFIIIRSSDMLVSESLCLCSRCLVELMICRQCSQTLLFVSNEKMPFKIPLRAHFHYSVSLQLSARVCAKAHNSPLKCFQKVVQSPKQRSYRTLGAYRGRLKQVV